MSIAPLISHNIAYLEQALRLLQDVSDQAYTEIRDPYFSSGIGEHLRHILEHYGCFLEGTSARRIDYDSRQRDTSISTDRARASHVVSTLIEGLRALDTADATVEVCLDGSPDLGDTQPWSQSTLRRELQYLQAHTVHHYALIAFILRLQGTAPHEDFGVAPSTLRHRLSADAK